MWMAARWCQSTINFAKSINDGIVTKKGWRALEDLSAPGICLLCKRHLPTSASCSLGEKLVERKLRFCKTVRIPQDPDILFIVWRRIQKFAKPCYFSLDKKFSSEAARSCKRIFPSYEGTSSLMSSSKTTYLRVMERDHVSQITPFVLFPALSA